MVRAAHGVGSNPAVRIGRRKRRPNVHILYQQADFPSRPRPAAPNYQYPPAASEHKLIFDTSDARRSLDDWELEDYVLVATIEGSLYALDRRTGATRWVLEGGGPAVRSMGNENIDTESVNTTKKAWKEQQPRWIVQPVEGGQLFLFDPEFGVLVHPIMEMLTTRNFH